MSFHNQQFRISVLQYFPSIHMLNNIFWVSNLGLIFSDFRLHLMIGLHLLEQIYFSFYIFIFVIQKCLLHLFSAIYALPKVGHCDKISIFRLFYCKVLFYITDQVFRNIFVYTHSTFHFCVIRKFCSILLIWISS